MLIPRSFYDTLAFSHSMGNGTGLTVTVLLLSPTDVLNEFIKDMDLARDDTGWFFAIAYNPSFQLPQSRL